MLAFVLCSTALGLLSSCGGKTVGNIGDAIEEGCIKFQLTPDQATALNALPHDRPSYCYGQVGEDGNNGDVHCDAEPKDRVLAAHCAMVPRQVFEGR